MSQVQMFNELCKDKAGCYYTVKSLALQVLEKAAEFHELRDDVDGLLQGADGIQLDELGVAQLLHDLRLRQEVLGVHRTCKLSVHIYNTGIVKKRKKIRPGSKRNNLVSSGMTASERQGFESRHHAK